MKKIIIICVIVFFCFNIIEMFDDRDEIRIRIIANSDSQYDQDYKKEVVKYLYENFNLEFSSYEQCDEYLTLNIEMIRESLCEKFSGINISYVKHNFYNKSYNNIVIDNKEYKTLLIEIDEALGENFWGVLFSKNYVETEETIIYNSYIVELFKKGERNV